MSDVCFVSGGRVWRVVGGEGEPGELACPFIEGMQRREASIVQRNAWKMQGSGAKFMGGGVPRGAMAADHAMAAGALTDVSCGRSDGEILYVVQGESVTGILALGEDGTESRLYHTNDYRFDQVAASADSALLACSSRHPSGTSHIVVMERSGARPRQVTDGDVIDSSPRWVPGSRALVYQSSGIARDPSGMVRGTSPSVICRLDLERGETTTVATSEGYDLLSPLTTADGSLWYVRRPRPVPRAFSWTVVLKDIVLFPWRVGVAIFGWLDFFSRRYGGKALSSGGPPSEGPELRHLLLQGNVVDAENALRDSAHAGDPVPGVAPQSWELVRRDAAGMSVVSRGVLGFDVDGDGSVILSNGRAILRQTADGNKSVIATVAGVERLAVT